MPEAEKHGESQERLSPTTNRGGIISAVHADTIAEDLELQPGDAVLQINGIVLRDIIDYRFAVADEQIDLLVHTQRDGEVVYEIEKDADDDLGIEFADPLFNRIRICNNACTFCFVTQMPRGLRQTLYVRDDDYRLSFLYGNFITLTNLSEADWQRIANQHLSPLYISVHASDPAVRARLLGKTQVPDVIEQIRRLGRAGIQVHTQIVACPGINDGNVLHQTIQDLAALYPVVQSIAVVPVGITRYRFTQMSSALSDAPLRCYEPPEAANMVDMLLSSSKQYHRRLGVNLVYPGDEFFLLSDRNIPPETFYDGYPQYFNGVGMTRDFLDRWNQVQHTLPACLPVPVHSALVCGILIAPVVQHMVDRLQQVGQLTVTLVPVVNHFFGETVTVSGLLTGQDVSTALGASDNAYQHAVLPRTMFDHTGTRTLDEYTPQHIADMTGRTVSLAGSPEEIVDYVRNMCP
jgi:putative radical SAM enzyme (TIGR03279 family)